MPCRRPASPPSIPSAALRSLAEQTIPSITDLSQLHAFLFERHGAYKATDPKAAAARLAGERPHELLSHSY